MNKKAMGTGGLFLAIIIGIGIIGGLAAFTVYQVGKMNQQSLIGGSGSGEPGGNVLKSYATETITFQAIDKLRADAMQGTHYNASAITPIWGGSAQAAVQIAGTASGGDVSIPVNTKFEYFVINRTNQYTVHGEGTADTTKTIPVKVTMFPQNATTSGGGLRVYVYDVDAAAYAGTWNATNINATTSGIGNLTISSIGLTAGAASKTYDIYMAIGSAYTQFGSTSIQIGCDTITDAKYTVGSDMIPITTLPSAMQNANVKKAFKATKNSVKSSDGQIKIGSLTFALNGGQTGSDIKCTIYDGTDDQSANQMTVLKDVINLDDSTPTDVGRANPWIHFLV